LKGNDKIKIETETKRIAIAKEQQVEFGFDSQGSDNIEIEIDTKRIAIAMEQQDELGFELQGSDEITIKIGTKQIRNKGQHNIESTRHTPLKTKHTSMTYQILIPVRQIGFKHQLMLDILDLGPDSH
jgi:hypothetical protein